MNSFCNTFGYNGTSVRSRSGKARQRRLGSRTSAEGVRSCFWLGNLVVKALNMKFASLFLDSFPKSSRTWPSLICRQHVCVSANSLIRNFEKEALEKVCLHKLSEIDFRSCDKFAANVHALSVMCETKFQPFGAKLTCNLQHILHNAPLANPPLLGISDSYWVSPWSTSHPLPLECTSNILTRFMALTYASAKHV